MIAAARLAALRQQGATAQAGPAAFSASAALFLVQANAHQPSENAWLGILDIFVRHQHHRSFPRSDAAGQVHQPTHAASQPPLAHGYVASAQPQLIEEEQEVVLWIHHEHSGCGKIMRCVCADTVIVCPVTSLCPYAVQPMC
jgi:3',5'-cyclic AMP phosphodiesterase CpdA